MIDLDAVAVDLCSAYQAEGSAAFVIRTMESGDVRIVGLALPQGMVCQMLRTAAEIYEQSSAGETVN